VPRRRQGGRRAAQVIPPPTWRLQGPCKRTPPPPGPRPRSRASRFTACRRGRDLRRRALHTPHGDRSSYAAAAATVTARPAPHAHSKELFGHAKAHVAGPRGKSSEPPGASPRWPPVALVPPTTDTQSRPHCRFFFTFFDGCHCWCFLLPNGGVLHGGNAPRCHQPPTRLPYHTSVPGASPPPCGSAVQPVDGMRHGCRPTAPRAAKISPDQPQPPSPHRSRWAHGARQVPPRAAALSRPRSGSTGATRAPPRGACATPPPP